MVNAWSLAWEEMNGTMDETFPIKKKEDGMSEEEIKFCVNTKSEGVFNVPSDTNLDDYEHSEAWYDYNRNDPDRENPFTDAFDYMMAESVVNGTTYPQAYVTDNDIDHVSLNYDELTLNIEDSAKKIMTDSRNKYHEKEILKDVEEYVSRTYNGHYTGTKHEYRNVQTIDLMASRDLASDFCQANILKYGSRYGSKDGRNKKDLLKVIHYAMLLLHFDEHYGKPSVTSGNIDHNMP
tara:strand:- start:753 stop:1460 length:708 start_codon:yes stop_codon:yes gene_type:complete